MIDQYLSDKIHGIKIDIWKKIKEWGQQTEILNLSHLNRIHNYIQKASNNGRISNEEGLNLVEILEIVTKRAPELMIEDENDDQLLTEGEVLKAQASKMIEWIKERKHNMDSEQFTYLKKIEKGLISYSIESKTTIAALKKYLIQYGFE